MSPWSPHGSGGARDRHAVALAGAVWLGAALSLPVPRPLALAVVVGGLGLRRWSLLAVGLLLLASSLGAAAVAGLVPPSPADVAGEVTLAGDPTRSLSGVRVDARLGDARVELQARGPAADALARRLTGERVDVVGTLGPVPHAVADRLARRHVVGIVDVESVGASSAGSPPHRLANGLRRTLASGAAPLGEGRPLFLGMVIGDDREQATVVADDFKAAGLTHLLAVSGQNVAFVLVLAAPLLGRLGLRSRWLTTLAVIGFFALVTRFEPSVLRASAMAAVACTAGGLGRRASRVRVLALAAGAVVLIDPFLVRSVSLLLSVGASAGIILLSGPLAARLPGPRWFADLLGVTLAAQVGVAPVLLPVFGSVPLATIPANLLAVPAAGPLMIWGLTGGLVAGVVGPPFDAWLHLPSGWLVAWVAAVARWGAGLPLGTLDAVGALILVALAAATTGMALLRLRPRLVAAAGAGAAVFVVALPVATPPGDLAGADEGAGARVWRAGGAVVVVLDDPWMPGVLAQLRGARVRSIDVVVVPRGGRLVAGSVLELRSRVPVRMVLAPDGHRVRGAVTPAAGKQAVGGLTLTVTDTAPALEVELQLARARASP